MLPIFLLLILQFMLPEIFTKHMTGCGYLPDVLINVCCFILDSGLDSHQSSGSFLLLSILSQGAGPGVKPFMHRKELSCLDVSGFSLPLLPAYYPSRITGKAYVLTARTCSSHSADCSGLALLSEGIWGFPSGLFMIPIQDPRYLQLSLMSAMPPSGSSLPSALLF